LNEFNCIFIFINSGLIIGFGIFFIGIDFIEKFLFFFIGSEIDVDAVLFKDMEINIIETFNRFLEFSSLTLEFREFVQNYSFSEIFWDIDTLDFRFFEMGDGFADFSSNTSEVTFSIQYGAITLIDIALEINGIILSTSGLFLFFFLGRVGSDVIISLEGSISISNT